MLKKYSMLSALIIILSTSLVMAETSIQQIQSPIYTDDMGRSHFLGRGGYSSVRHIDMGSAQADAINEVSKDMQKVQNEIKQNSNQVETDITNVIKERTNIPVSSRTKATFSSEERKIDATATFGHGATNLPYSGVNESKTIYTDDIGRLHFFGKGNIIKE